MGFLNFFGNPPPSFFPKIRPNSVPKATSQNRPNSQWPDAATQVGFHSLRHSHITALLENGIPMDAVRQQAGHASLEMTARYYHASDKTLQATTAALPEIGKANALPAAGAKLEAALAGLEGLSKEELEKVGERVKEMMGK